MWPVKPLQNCTREDFQKILDDLQQEKSGEETISKQEEILKRHGIDESYFVCVFPTWRDFASVLKNSKDQDPNEFFEKRLRECLGIEKEPEESENLEPTERELMVKTEQAEKLGQYKIAFDLQRLMIKKLKKKMMQAEQL